MKELGASWSEAVSELPLQGLLLMLRQQQAQRVENVMTLADKEMIDELTKKRKN